MKKLTSIILVLLLSPCLALGQQGGASVDRNTSSRSVDERLAEMETHLEELQLTKDFYSSALSSQANWYVCLIAALLGAFGLWSLNSVYRAENRIEEKFEDMKKEVDTAVAELQTLMDNNRLDLNNALGKANGLVAEHYRRRANANPQSAFNYRIASVRHYAMRADVSESRDTPPIYGPLEKQLNLAVEQLDDLLEGKTPIMLSQYRMKILEEALELSVRAGRRSAKRDSGYIAQFIGDKIKESLSTGDPSSS